jgi:hypothetical protein
MFFSSIPCRKCKLENFSVNMLQFSWLTVDSHFLLACLFLLIILNKVRNSFDAILFRLFGYNMHISFVYSTEHVIHLWSALTDASTSYTNHTVVTTLSFSELLRIPSVSFTARPFNKFSKIIVIRKTNNKIITWLVYGKVSNKGLYCRGKLTGAGTAYANPTVLALIKKNLSFNSHETYWI